MVEEMLNSSKGKQEPTKKNIIIWFDDKTSDYADMLKGVLSICEPSDAADFNKKIHINRYDLVMNRDNKASISENIYEIFIGQPGKMDWCKEVYSNHGLHFCMMGKTAHIYVDESHTGKKELIKFAKYSALIEKDYEKLVSQRSEGGMTSHSIVLWNPSDEEKTFQEQFNEEAMDNYVDVPQFFKSTGKKIGAFFKSIFRLMGFGRQSEIIKKKYQTLIKDFYIHYLPMLIGELNAK